MADATAAARLQIPSNLEIYEDLVGSSANEALIAAKPLSRGGRSHQRRMDGLIGDVLEEELRFPAGILERDVVKRSECSPIGLPRSLPADAGSTSTKSPEPWTFAFPIG